MGQKYQVLFRKTVVYDCEVEIEANSEAEALENAKNADPDVMDEVDSKKEDFEVAPIVTIEIPKD